MKHLALYLSIVFLALVLGLLLGQQMVEDPGECLQSGRMP